jgi:hypothetical protein
MIWSFSPIPLFAIFNEGTGKTTQLKFLYNILICYVIFRASFAVMVGQFMAKILEALRSVGFIPLFYVVSFKEQNNYFFLTVCIYCVNPFITKARKWDVYVVCERDVFYLF